MQTSHLRIGLGPTERSDPPPAAARKNRSASAPAPLDKILSRLTSSERDAIRAGVFAADAAIAYCRRFAVLRLFVGDPQSPRAKPRLEALQAYAELRRALLQEGRMLPATSLTEAGYGAAKIAQFDAMIAI